MSIHYVPARKTPDVLGVALAKNDDEAERIEIASTLAWDYSQLGDNATAGKEHTVAIKRSERRASEAIVDAGKHLIAMKELLDHGQWGDWLNAEFSMSDRTAQRMMAVAEQFGDKTDTVSFLSDSVLYMLSAPSTPEAARAQVIEQAQATGQSPTKAEVKAVIAEHKPQPVTRPVQPPPTVQPSTPVYTSVDTAPTGRTVWGATAHTWEGYELWDSEDQAQYDELSPTWRQPFTTFNALSELDKITRWRVAARIASELNNNFAGSLDDKARRLRVLQRPRNATIQDLVASIQAWVDKRFVMPDSQSMKYACIKRMIADSEDGAWVSLEKALPTPYSVESVATAMSQVLVLLNGSGVLNVPAPEPAKPEVPQFNDVNPYEGQQVVRPAYESHPLDCYEDPEFEAEQHDIGDPDEPVDWVKVALEDKESLDRLAWPRRMRDLWELKDWFKQTVEGKFKQFGKLTGRDSMTLAAARELRSLMAVLEAEMDALQNAADAMATLEGGDSPALETKTQ